MREKVAFILMERIASLIRESGANQREAGCALRAAEAMLPEMDLPVAPALVIE
jgi:hypothetical protein